MWSDRPFDDVCAHLQTRLSEPLPGPAAQRRFAPLPTLPDWTPDQRPAQARSAAVLILLFPGTRGTALPLTLRRSTLPAHAGQISLPGGALDAGESAEAAALREADEEVGVPPGSVTLLGRLSPLWVPVSNFVVTPVVGMTPAPPAFRLHEVEVETLIETPLPDLLDRTIIRWGRRQRAGSRVRYPYFDIQGHRVWGATAMILSEFAALFVPDHTPGPAPR